MKASEIRQMTTKEVVERLEEDQAMLTRNRINHTISPLDNPIQLKQIRRNIARLKTELRQRELNDKK